jgi:hypothetical protein
MTHQYAYGTVRHSLRRAVYAVRVQEEMPEPIEVEAIAERMREWLARRGELSADVVVVAGSTKETLRLSGNAHSVSLVRAAMFNAALSWTPLALD